MSQIRIGKPESKAIVIAPVAAAATRAPRPRRRPPPAPAPPAPQPAPAPVQPVQPTPQATPQAPAPTLLELVARLAHRVNPESHIEVIRLVQQLQAEHLGLATAERCLAIARAVESGRPVPPGDLKVYEAVCGSRPSTEIEAQVRERKERRDRVYEQLRRLAEERGATEELRRVLEYLGIG